MNEISKILNGLVGIFLFVFVVGMALVNGWEGFIAVVVTLVVGCTITAIFGQLGGWIITILILIVGGFLITSGIF